MQQDGERRAGGWEGGWVGVGLKREAGGESGGRLRPRGELNEDVFARACVRSGQGVQTCRYDTLKRATVAAAR